ETLIVRLSLADRLRINASADRRSFRTLALSLEMAGDPAIAPAVPVDQSNLVLMAAAALAERAQVRGFADIVLEKRIPAAAGLGGGSADAAATLEALNELWEVGLGPEALSSVAASIGADVPALLAPNAALARGRGERTE